MKRALPAIVLSAGGVWLLVRVQSDINASTAAVPVEAATGTGDAAPSTTTITTSTTEPTTTTSTTAPTSTTAATPPPTPAPTAPATPAPPATRTVVGPVVTHRFGPVQVQATVSGDRITAVEALQVPTGDPRSAAISRWAVPRLEQQAVSAQTGDLAAVTGATLTSEAFGESLQAALVEGGMGG